MSDETDSSSPGGDGEPPKGGDASGREAIPNRTALIVTIVILILIVAVALVWWFLIRDTRPDVWQETTVPYDETACEEEGVCQEYGISAGGHGGHGEEAAVELYYNPEIDDEIAQWGDCLGSVFVCIETGMSAAAESGEEVDRASLITSCVADSECPGECKDRFAERSRGRDFDGLEAVFFDMFVDERGYCVPREADQ